MTPGDGGVTGRTGCVTGNSGPDAVPTTARNTGVTNFSSEMEIMMRAGEGGLTVFVSLPCRHVTVSDLAALFHPSRGTKSILFLGGNHDGDRYLSVFESDFQYSSCAQE